MPKPLTITGVCGWAIPPLWFEELIQNYFPQAKIKVLYPENPFDSKTAKKFLEEHPADLILGYSLGSLWLLYHKRFLSSFSSKALLAPILAFPEESGMGGKITRVQLKNMIKWLSKKSADISIIQAFYTISGLQITDKFLKDISDRSKLIRGLEFLNEIEVTPSGTLDFIALIGENDSLLEGKAIKRQLPQVRIIEQAGHAPEPLLAALSKILKS